ncbi:hypothetical protein GTW51_22905 [Aurantimonas aggregata]|uniref:Uncharacterized protein n=1 Tax=Aurantimonas aggregata TaxID=2047720 RepID=A0A6L9MNH5_9HYPH|nr:hypothetical protein [Aurantimonas aggregata]NDV89494.1 hypothetical protein [Aurantimonas aggregata]
MHEIEPDQTSSLRKTQFRSSVPVIVALLVGALLLFFNPFAENASRYNTQVTASAITLYGTLRVANSVMSIAKDVDVQASGVVASVTASPGRALEPVTDTIERLADLLFVIVLVSGVLSIIIMPAATVGAGLLVVLAGSLLMLSTLPERYRAPVLVGFLNRGIAVALIAALIVPAAFSIAFLAGDQLTAQAWNQASAVFGELDEAFGNDLPLDLPVVIEPEAAVETDQAGSLPDEDAPGIFSRALGGIGDAYEGSTEAIGNAASAVGGLAQAIPERIKGNARMVTEGLQLATQLFEASVAIAVAYLIKLIVLPVLIVGATLWICTAKPPKPAAAWVSRGGADNRD